MIFTSFWFLFYFFIKISNGGYKKKNCIYREILGTQHNVRNIRLQYFKEDIRTVTYSFQIFDFFENKIYKIVLNEKNSHNYISYYGLIRASCAKYGHDKLFSYFKKYKQKYGKNIFFLFHAINNFLTKMEIKLLQ